MLATSTILAADIGGTNCRFALFTLERGVLTLRRSAWVRTRDLRDIEDVLHACDVLDLGVPAAETDAVVLAIAGPVHDPLCGVMTNAPLKLDLRAVLARRALRRARLINDFAAQAYACLTPVGDEAVTLLPGALPAPEHATKGIVGAGTGFGTAWLLRDSIGEWIAVPAEGGNTTFPFVGKDEAEFHDFICKELNYPYARGDDVLTGLGLTLLHRFLEGVTLPPEGVSATALAHDTPTRRWYARFYGRACRNWVLTTLCMGGLHITGGIAAKNPGVLTCQQFAEEFYSTPRYLDLLESVPVKLNTNENSGLWGAAWVGARMLRTIP